MSFTPQMLATLEAQRDAFASDAHLRERAAAWGDATPAECREAVLSNVPYQEPGRDHEHGEHRNHGLRMNLA